MKLIQNIIIILLLASYVCAQTPTKTIDPLDTLLESIQNNTDAMEAANKKIEDQYGFLQDQNRKWSSTLILGNSVFLALGYVFILFIERIRRRKQKRTHEQYIKELEDKLIATEKKLVDNMRYVQDETTLLLMKNKSLQEKYEAIYDPTKLQVRTYSKTSFLIGVLTTLALTLIYQHLGGN